MVKFEHLQCLWKSRSKPVLPRCQRERVAEADLNNTAHRGIFVKIDDKDAVHRRIGTPAYKLPFGNQYRVAGNSDPSFHFH